MTWTKLDDDTCVTDQPLSAFIGKRLTDNVNAYAAQLTRLNTFVYPTTSAGAPKVKWASTSIGRGTAITVDVGINALFYNFRILCQTTNASLGGTFTIHGIDDGVYVQKFFAGSATATVVEIPFTYATPASGLRGFHIGWTSEVSVSSSGQFIINGGVANQVFCSPSPAAQFPFTLAAGYHEMYHLLRIASSGGLPSPDGDARLYYQICAFRFNTLAAQPPVGVLVTYGDIETTPPILTTDTSNGNQKVSNLYELGRLELYSIAVEIVANAPVEIAPYAYQQPTPINAIANRINAGMSELQPNAATHITSGSFLNCVLPAGEELTFTFFIQTDKSVQQLLTSFKAVAYTLGQATPDITFSVRDAQGATVGTDITHVNMPVPRVAAITRSDRRVAGTAGFMNGVLAGDEKWGLRDAMSYTDVMMGLPVRFAWGPNVQNDIAWGQDASVDTVYTGIITATSDLYIYGFNCKVQ